MTTKDDILKTEEPRSRAERKRLGLQPLTLQQTPVQNVSEDKEKGDNGSVNINKPDATPQEAKVIDSNNPDVPNLYGVSTYDDIFKKLSAGRDYEKEKELQEKRVKIGRIADGLNAIYNVYARARGMEPVVDRPQQSYSERAQRRRDMIANEEMQNAAAALQYIAREKEQRLADLRERQRLGIRYSDLNRLNEKQAFEEEKHKDLMGWRNEGNELKRESINNNYKVGMINANNGTIRANKAKDYNAETSKNDRQSNTPKTNVRNSRYGNQGSNKVNKISTGINWR